MQKKEFSLDWGGKTFTAAFTDLADQANGSVLLSCDDTVIMATAVISKDGKRNPGFFNLTVEYAEKHYASGQILGGKFRKREGRPSDTAVLHARVIDRTIRPLFEKHIKNAVQVVVTVLSIGDFDPGILGVNAVSLALATSNIPWNGPVGATHISSTREEPSTLRVNHYDGVNYSDTDSLALDLTVCGKEGNINMIESMAFHTDEALMGQAFDLAVENISIFEKWQKKIISEIGKEKMVFPKQTLPENVEELFVSDFAPRIQTEIFAIDGKKKIYSIEDDWLEAAHHLVFEEEKVDELMSLAKNRYHDYVDEVIHIEAITNQKRPDLRKLDQVRALYSQAGGVSSRLHGTGIFYRGETHVLSVATLGAPDDAQEMDETEAKGSKRFMHHYNFPPYSAGETGRFGGFNRREIGHGMLAEKALTAILPNKLEFPYTIRVVSESMASNGSTSQAAICASSLALMDAGVPISEPVAGIAMGLMQDQKDKSKYVLISDIQGPEDHHGDMDFKVAGSRRGITAIQMDIKVDGIAPSILKEALEKAKEARFTILDNIEAHIKEPRSDINPHAPKIEVHKIKPTQIGLVIGSGGKTVNEIRDNTGAEITIEEDGTVYATGTHGSATKAIEVIKELTKEWKVGDDVTGKVIKIIDGIGAVVQFSSVKEGLVHISEIASFRVEDISKHLKVGQEVPARIIKIDIMKGRIGLSIKQIAPDFIKK